jgi:hypothetical protein
MRITFHKISDERHRLEVSADDGLKRESVECETRSYLTHDLLHYAVEAEAGLQSGFWGRLHRGSSLAELNDWSRPMDPEIAAIEQIVGALSPAVKGKSAAGMRRFAAALGTTMPDWLTEAFVLAVQDRMRGLLGHWTGTRCGTSMELAWPADAPRRGG